MVEGSLREVIIGSKGLSAFANPQPLPQPAFPKFSQLLNTTTKLPGIVNPASPASFLGE
jgi:hypothetical protein